MPRVGDDTPTCWTVIRGAAEGRGAERSRFVAAYTGVIRAYLLARWRRSPLAQNADDAVQEVFVVCFRAGGALARADAELPGGFRAYLFGIVRNVAREIEKREARRQAAPLDSWLEANGVEADDASPSQHFDRAWAVEIMRQAAEAQERAAEAHGPDAVRRVEILRLRFREGRPIREIAEQWGEDAALLHREYARARREFEEALIDVLRFHGSDPGAGARTEARELLGLLER